MIESLKDTAEKHGFAPMAGVLVFGLLLFFCAVPGAGQYVTDKAIADLHEAAQEGGGHGGH